MTVSRIRPDLPKRARFEILSRDGFRCVYCGTGADEAKLVVDHVVAHARGGDSTDRNLVTACEPCNQGKGARPVGSGRLPERFLVRNRTCNHCHKPLPLVAFSNDLMAFCTQECFVAEAKLWVRMGGN